MPHILLTGFEPFGGESVNPSWEAVRRLDGAEIAGARIHARLLPCMFGAANEALSREVEALTPDLVLCVGQAGGRAEMSIERVAINVDDARIPDNAGVQPVDDPVVAGGPPAYFASLPIKAVVARLREAGIPAAVSQTAGTFVCNHVFYGACHLAATRFPAMRAGFIHVPYSPEQAARHPGAPSVAVETVVAGLRLAVATSLEVVQDLRVAEGATH